MAPKSLNLSSKSRVYTTSQTRKPTTTTTTTPQPETISIADRLQKYNSTIGHGSYAAENEEKLLMTKLFSIRSAHLPGNNWCQDWFQWMQNNHPILGLCCRHHLNPIGSLPRCILLISSACYGLIATNLVYLFYRGNEGANGSIGSLITYERIVLFTVGGVFHSLADLCMWHLTACACCLPDFGNRRKTLGFLGKVGPFVAVLVAAMMVALATFVVMMRLDHEEQMKGAAAEGGGGDGEENETNSYRFLISFLMELGTVWLVWHPALSTFFFTGLIWPIFPCIGGRPKELKRQADEANQNNITPTKSAKFARPIPIV